MKLEAMRGAKLFREVNDSVEIIRIKNIVFDTKTKSAKSFIIIYNTDSGHIEKEVDADYFEENNFSILEPDGLLTFNVVDVMIENESRYDIIVTGSKFLNLKLGDRIPFAICRQGITDVFYNLMINDESQMIVGLSINRNDCPANLDFKQVLACDAIVYSESINFYKNDTIKTFLDWIDKKVYNKVLKESFERYVETQTDPSLSFKKMAGGWCKDIDTLLTINNFQFDISQMFDIVELDFDIKKYIEQKPLPTNSEVMYNVLNGEVKKWISDQLVNIDIDEASIIEYDHDIDPAEFKNVNKIFVRDCNDILYMIVYTTDGEKHVADLEAATEKKCFSDEFRIKFYNKYNLNNK